MADDVTLSPDLDRILDQVLLAIEEDNTAALESMLSSLHTSDIADLIVRVPLPELRMVVYRHVPDELTGDVLDLLPERVRDDLVEDLTPNELVEAVAAMAPDDAADLVTDLTPETQKEVLDHIPAGQSEAIRELMQYPEDTAGGLMTPRYAAIRSGVTVAQAIDELRRLADSEREYIYYAYVVDDENRLQGVLSLRDLLLAPSDRPVDDFMSRKVHSANVLTDREEAARLLDRYGYLALPVVDDENHLLGVVTVDDAIEVIRQEQSEDVQKMAAVQALEEPYMVASIGTLVRKRGTWLSALFLGEMLTASAMAHFEDEIARAVVLALFVPLIISSGGNSGSQASTLVIRAMALGEVRLGDWWRVMRRELACGLLLGLLLGFIGFCRVHLWQWAGWVDYTAHYHLVAFTVAASLVGVVLWGTLVGGMLPFVLRAIRLDPATISAPFVATLADVTGLVIYFTTALLILRGTLL